MPVARVAGASEAQRLGEAAGILAGDLGLIAAMRAITRCEAPAPVVERLLDLFESTLHATAAGELADVRLQLGPADGPVVLREALAVAELKTALYSFQLPLRAGALLADASPEVLAALDEIGSLLGIGFQLFDDLLGVFGDERRTGKSALGDLREGKRTALIAHASTTDAWPALQPLLGREDLGEREARSARSLLTAAWLPRLGRGPRPLARDQRGRGGGASRSATGAGRLPRPRDRGDPPRRGPHPSRDRSRGRPAGPAPRPGRTARMSTDLPTSSDAPLVLVTGASGYIGGRLVPALLAAGLRVRAMARHADRLEDRPWRAQVEVVEADVEDPASLEAALDGIHVAYYLIHAMGGGRSFAERDRQGARSFAAAAEHADVRRIVYLGGIHPEGEELSAHMASRQEVGEILLGGKVPAVVLRAAVILGSGSASFEIMRHLAERLPVMVAPRWVRNRIQPIAVRDVLHYLVGAARLEGAPNRTFDVGGPDVLTFAQLLHAYARAAGLPAAGSVPCRC